MGIFKNVINEARDSLAKARNNVSWFVDNVVDRVKWALSSDKSTEAWDSRRLGTVSSATAMILAWTVWATALPKEAHAYDLVTAPKEKATKIKSWPDVKADDLNEYKEVNKKTPRKTLWKWQIWWVDVSLILPEWKNKSVLVNNQTWEEITLNKFDWKPLYPNEITQNWTDTQYHVVWKKRIDWKPTFNTWSMKADWLGRALKWENTLNFLVSWSFWETLVGSQNFDWKTVSCMLQKDWTRIIIQEENILDDWTLTQRSVWESIYAKKVGEHNLIVTKGDWVNWKSNYLYKVNPETWEWIFLLDVTHLAPNWTNLEINLLDWNIELIVKHASLKEWEIEKAMLSFSEDQINNPSLLWDENQLLEQAEPNLSTLYIDPSKEVETKKIPFTKGDNTWVQLIDYSNWKWEFNASIDPYNWNITVTPNSIDWIFKKWEKQQFWIESTVYWSDTTVFKTKKPVDISTSTPSTVLFGLLWNVYKDENKVNKIDVVDSKTPLNVLNLLWISWNNNYEVTADWFIINKLNWNRVVIIWTGWAYVIGNNVYEYNLEWAGLRVIEVEKFNGNEVSWNTKINVWFNEKTVDVPSFTVPEIQLTEPVNDLGWFQEICFKTELYKYLKWWVLPEGKEFRIIDLTFDWDIYSHNFKVDESWNVTWYGNFGGDGNGIIKIGIFDKLSGTLSLAKTSSTEEIIDKINANVYIIDNDK